MVLELDYPRKSHPLKAVGMHWHDCYFKGCLSSLQFTFERLNLFKKTKVLLQELQNLTNITRRKAAWLK